MTDTKLKQENFKRSINISARPNNLQLNTENINQVNRTDNHSCDILYCQEDEKQKHCVKKNQKVQALKQV